MKNWFFNQALARAGKLAGHPGRIIKLLVQLSVKLYHTDFRNLKADQLVSKISVLGRMAGAYARREYTVIPWQTMITLLAALLYFINPIDLIPDVVPALGLTDDFTVLIWVYGTAEKEIEKFLLWETTTMATVAEDQLPSSSL